MAPLTEPELFTLMEASPDLVLRDCHVLIRRCDEYMLLEALGQSTIVKKVEGAFQTESMWACAGSEAVAMDDVSVSSAAVCHSDPGSWRGQQPSIQGAAVPVEPEISRDASDAASDHEDLSQTANALFTIEHTFISVREPSEV